MADVTVKVAPILGTNRERWAVSVYQGERSATVQLTESLAHSVARAVCERLEKEGKTIEVLVNEGTGGPLT